MFNSKSVILFIRSFQIGLIKILIKKTSVFGNISKVIGEKVITLIIIISITIEYNITLTIFKNMFRKRKNEKFKRNNQFL